jgi:hypothetical protein
VPEARYAVDCPVVLREDNQQAVRRRVPSSVLTMGISWNKFASCHDDVYQPTVSRYREWSGVVWERRILGVCGVVAIWLQLPPVAD